MLDRKMQRKQKSSDSVLWQKPYTSGIKKNNVKHKNATKMFDYSALEDQLSTVSWSNDSHPTGVVKPVNGIQTFPPTSTSCAVKRTYIKKFVNDHSYKDPGPTTNQSGDVMKINT